MVFGGIETERLQLNEETVWTGKDEDYNYPESLEGLKTVRRLLFEGKYLEAQEVAQEKIMSIADPAALHTYQTLGDLNLFFGAHRNVSDYRRELDIETAVARVSYQAGRVFYTREIFSSAPDQVLVVRLTADREKFVSFAACLSRPGNKAKIEINGNVITISEHVGDGVGVKMVARLMVTLPPVTATKSLPLIPSETAFTVMVSSPRIVQVRDVPNDQGGHVFVTWHCPLDQPGYDVVKSYRVWRRVPYLASGSGTSSNGMRCDPSDSSA